MTKLPGVLQLPDDELMLALCVREENLKNPSEWCQEFRACWVEKAQPIRDSEHAERLMEWSSRLAMEAAGDRVQGVNDAFGLPLID